MNPKIESIEPEIAKVAEVVILRGEGFGEISGKILLAHDQGIYQYDSEEIVNFWSDTKICFTVPSYVATGPIQVRCGSDLSNKVILQIERESAKTGFIESAEVGMDNKGHIDSSPGFDKGLGLRASKNKRFRIAAGRYVFYEDVVF